MKANESILSQKVISYNDIKLLKSRSNKEQKDLISYYNFEPIKIDDEGGAKGLQWLKSLLNSKGEPRKNINLGFREIEIINQSTQKDFYFCGFYDAGNGYFKNFQPIYEIGGMEYIPYCNGEKIYIIG